MYGWVFLRRYITHFLVVDSLSDPNLPDQLLFTIVHGSARNNSVVVHRIALCFHQSLPAAGGASIPIRELRAGGIERRDDGLRRDSHLMDCPISVIRQFFGMPDSEGRIVPSVASIRAGGSI